ncbi:NAD-dependent succinate-semialdehyde dehydrogenase [Aliidiomarina sanyensis]|uniref:Succinate-semialdehyde dehydrogenase (NADP(+)) n=1 Tax=Aliidiomarina sanyensis TaxID=1249555 RepID=A0A432WHX3_9GAMM|nr:NAD-dependent succinate-semialdehyde dehydrogenase [Aliidiomarina sanyensis]RUO33422.1 succinate-semialdehyde dehydrogenase (NADP(+)) [Aliidiomarina sanyensis]
MPNISEKAANLLHQACFVHGRWQSSDSGDMLDVTNPATGERIGRVPALTALETAEAIDSAHEAFTSWRKESAKTRADILKAWYRLIMEHAEPLAELMCVEMGKPVTEAKGEVAYAASYIEWYAEEARRMYGDTIPGLDASNRVVVTREPVGVCVAITPWNFPAAMITRKVGPALAAGCTMVVRPASESPFTALALAALGQEAGLPAGVFNVITGSSKVIGPVFTDSPLVKKLSFTGSTAVGSHLMAASAKTIKRVSLELGGNAPFIVFDDADIDAAVDGAIASKFRNAGQTCVCANRIYVQAGVHDAFVEKFVAKVKALKVGDGLEPDVQIGPLINQGAVDKVTRHINDAKQQGGEIMLGGKPHERGGLWFEPTVVVDCTQHMLCAREETFGPLAPIFKFEKEEEAIAWANDTEFGLAAYFYATNLYRVQRVAEALEAGMVGINTGILSNATAPFGGVKSSGIGREGSHQGLDEYTEWKYLSYGGF